jgi:hypothetical protein
MKAIFKNGATVTIIPELKRQSHVLPIDKIDQRSKYGRVIRIDNQVWDWLVTNAQGDENPNAVLRRLAGLPTKARHSHWHEARKLRIDARKDS